MIITTCPGRIVMGGGKKEVAFPLLKLIICPLKVSDDRLSVYTEIKTAKGIVTGFKPVFFGILVSTD